MKMTSFPCWRFSYALGAADDVETESSATATSPPRTDDEQRIAERITRKGGQWWRRDR